MSKRAEEREASGIGSSSMEVPTQREHHQLSKWIERIEPVAYIAVAILFLFSAFAMLVYSVLIFPQNFREDDFPHAIIILVNDLLLVVIILEVLRTILHFLTSHVLSIYPFLIIAAISATRRILTIGAQVAITEEVQPDEFNRAMVDLGINALVILVVAVAIFLTARTEPPDLG